MTTDKPTTSPWTAEQLTAFASKTLKNLSEMLAELPVAEAKPTAKPTKPAAEHAIHVNRPEPEPADGLRDYIGATKILSMHIAAALVDAQLLDYMYADDWSEGFIATVNTIDRVLCANPELFDAGVILRKS